MIRDNRQNENRDISMARRVAERVRAAGGTAYYVGGFVRDRLMGRMGKDVDIEVHGITPETLREILDSLGERTEMGASFGIYGLRHCTLDIAMPRRERAIGRGHRDFDISVDPFLGTKEAARRRDFTVNAMMEDVLTGEVLDPFGGQRDLAARVLRHVDDRSFPEDPLRVLRAAQFSARLGFSVAPETVALCRTVDLTALARERVLEEMKKAFLQSAAPSVFFRVLSEMDQLDFWFPEVRDLAGVPQDPDFHPEGDGFEHTMRVLDEAAKIREEACHPLIFLLSALCHDFGKAETTAKGEDGRIHAYGHDAAGVPLAERFLMRLTDEREILRGVPNLVALHMRPGALTGQQAGRKSYMRLFDASFCPEDLILLFTADRLGSGADPENRRAEEKLYGELAVYRARMAEPWITAADLMEAGIPPGPLYSEALAYAKRLHLAGVNFQEAKAQVLAFAKRETGIGNNGSGGTDGQTDV